MGYRKVWGIMRNGYRKVWGRMRNGYRKVGEKGREMGIEV